MLRGLALAHEHALEVAGRARASGEHGERTIEGVEGGGFGGDATREHLGEGDAGAKPEALDAVEGERGDDRVVNEDFEATGMPGACRDGGHARGALRRVGRIERGAERERRR